MLLALRITDTEFSLIALLGLFLLIGIVMKNAILMIDFALAAERRDRLEPLEAIRRAALLRRPLGTAILGGLAVSQLLTLCTTPVIYLYLDRLRLRFHRAMAARATERQLVGLDK